MCCIRIVRDGFGCLFVVVALFRSLLWVDFWRIDFDSNKSLAMSRTRLSCTMCLCVCVCLCVVRVRMQTLRNVKQATSRHRTGSSRCDDSTLLFAAVASMVWYATQHTDTDTHISSCFLVFHFICVCVDFFYSLLHLHPHTLRGKTAFKLKCVVVVKPPKIQILFKCKNGRTLPKDSE